MEAPQELVAALTAHGEALAAELRALDEMPQVKLMPASVFDRATPPGSVAQHLSAAVLRKDARPEVQQFNGCLGVPDARRGRKDAEGQGHQAARLGGVPGEG